jgi:prolipoprotein diacylglyceryltransferase
VEYTNVNSLSFYRPPMHFVTAYEVLGDFVILGVLLALWKFRVFKRDGILFFIYAFLYSFLRFWISFLRVDKEIALGLSMAQLIALGVIAVSLVAFALFIIRRPRAPVPEPAA